MRATIAGTAGERPRRWRIGDQRGPGAGFRRGGLAAGLATAAISGQLLFARPTLAAAAGLVALGRVSRWRPHWLAAATACTVIWLFASGPAAAVAAFTAGSQRQASLLLAAAIHPRLFARTGVMTAGAGSWGPTGLPIALLAACGEAGLVLWLAWWRPDSGSPGRWQWRPGLIAAVRRRKSAAALATGHTATSHGCAIAVATDSGKLAGFSWAQAAHGVLLTGADRDLLGLAITSAAVRRRKTVVVLECGGSTVTERVGQLARSLGVPATTAGVATVAGAIGRAIRRRETVLIGTLSATAGPNGGADLAAVLTELRGLGLRADCLTWISGVEFMDPALLAELLVLGPATGTVVVLSTMSSEHAAHLAPEVSVVAVGHPAGIDLRLTLAAHLGDGDARAGLVPHRPGQVTLLVSSPGRAGPAPFITACCVVPVRLENAR